MRNFFFAPASEQAHTAVYREIRYRFVSSGGWVGPRQAAEKRQSSDSFSLLFRELIVGGFVSLGRQGVQRRRQSSDPNLFTTSCSRRSLAGGIFSFLISHFFRVCVTQLRARKKRKLKLSADMFKYIFSALRLGKGHNSLPEIIISHTLKHFSFASRSSWDETLSVRLACAEGQWRVRRGKGVFYLKIYELHYETTFIKLSVMAWERYGY